MGLLSGSGDADRAEELCELARSDPDAAAGAADELRELLASDEADSRTAAADALFHLAPSHPDAVEPAVDRLLSRLDDGDASSRRRAADALVALVDADPATFSAWVETTAPRLDDDDPYVRATIANVFALLAAERPSNVLSAVEDLWTALVDPGDWDVRVFATGALADIAVRHPDEVVPAVEQTIANAGKPVPALQVAAVDLLATVGVDQPGVVDDEVDEVLADIAQNAPPSQREAALLAIGRLGSACPGCIPTALETVAPALAADDRAVRRGAAAAYVAIASSRPDAVPTDEATRQRLWWLADEVDQPIAALLDRLS
ncbi:hypothetical protein [Haloarchaeobius sp. DYHT-AS-18]|uniref:hypothetical protein n=1 Tax=Haloarchaeobius sp. DYHT-AS-18 TaxID=3446117 RepID=UPI003EBB4D4A